MATFRVSPMALASAALLLGAALLPWMGLVTAAVVDGLAFPVFGVQATLWDLASYGSPIAVDPRIAIAAALLLVSAGAAALRWNRIGALLAGSALAVFVGGTWGLFGIHAVGPALTIVALGPGFAWAVAGIVMGVVAYRFPPRSLAQLVLGLRNPGRLARMGLFLAAVFLVIDAADHAAGGNALAVLGDGEVEPWLHALFIGSVAGLAALALLTRAWSASRSGAVLIALAAGGLLADGIFHTVVGDLGELVGHTGAEAIAHLATYYGIALLVVSRFVLRTT